MPMRARKELHDQENEHTCGDTDSGAALSVIISASVFVGSDAKLRNGGLFEDLSSRHSCQTYSSSSKTISKVRTIATIAILVWPCLASPCLALPLRFRIRHMRKLAYYLWRLFPLVSTCAYHCVLLASYHSQMYEGGR